MSMRASWDTAFLEPGSRNPDSGCQKLRWRAEKISAADWPALRAGQSHRNKESSEVRTGTFIERVKRNTEKARREQSVSVSVDYEDARALLACAEALKKHEPNHVALQWLHSGPVVFD